MKKQFHQLGRPMKRSKGVFFDIKGATPNLGLAWIVKTHSNLIDIC